MSHRFQLGGLNDSALLAGLSSLAIRGNGLTAELLAHLAEVSARLLHLELGFASLHAYCVKELKMSEGAAGRRVVAARVCRRFPVGFGLVANGDLHLSALCALEPYLNEENSSALFAESAGKTRREVEELLAVRFPKPDVRPRIVRLPARASVNPQRKLTDGPLVDGPVVDGPVVDGPVVDGPRALEAPSLVLACGVAPGNTPLISSRPRTARREIEALSAERFGVHFTANRELRALIDRARAVASHRLPSGDLAGLIQLALEELVKREEQRRFAVGGRPRVTPPGGVTRSRDAKSGRRRGISAAVRREVYQRDGARCTFVAVDGRRCEAQRWLELDHIEPWARRGGDGAGNLRLRCRAHNLLHARHCFGAAHLAAKRAVAMRAL